MCGPRSVGLPRARRLTQEVKHGNINEGPGEPGAQAVMSRIGSSWNGMVSALSGRATLRASAVMVLVGGTDAVAIRFSNLELPPS